ncbi:ABC transporter permease [Candidatus Beckwithbacteria bacterium]|nr:ABC transporter permease [Candidatus Beckwithbacteria bacterium]
MSQTITIIKPKSKLTLLDLKEIWQFKELFFTFAHRDIKLRYKQTIIGGLWAIIQPLTTMIIFSFFFGKLAKIPSDGVPYPIFSYSGLLLWTFFANAISMASVSMINSASIITKVYFPRLIVPVSATIVFFIDYFISFFILLFLIFFYKFPLRIELLLLPLILFFTWILACGIGLILSALNVKYRDVRYAIPFLLQILIYITPVIYPTSVSGKFQWLVNLNPMTGYIEAHRALILGLPFNYGELLISIGLTMIILVCGIFYFKSVEKKFADII